MNYGRQGVKKQQLDLNARAPKWGHKFLLLLTEILLIALLAVVIIGGSFGIGVFNGIISTAPDTALISISPNKRSSFIYDSEGNQTAKLVAAESNRILVTIDKVPLDLQHAFVAIEDTRFYTHNGIDIQGIIRAGVDAIKKHGLGQGASTITQQLLKNNVFVDWVNEENDIQKVKRKIQEQYLATQVEKVYSKDIIMENYLNTINLGHNTLGVESACRTYFGKSVSELNLSECALIAGITQNPSKFDPIVHPENSKDRRDTVLYEMLSQGYISEAEYDEAIADDVYSRIEMHAIESANSSILSYFDDEVVKQVTKDLKAAGYTDTQVYSMLYSGGLKIYSTQDPEIQRICDEAVADEANYPDGTLWLLKYRLSVEHEDGTLSHYSEEMYKSYFQQKDPNFNMLYKSQEAAYEAMEKYRQHVMSETDDIRAETIELTPQPQISITIADQKTGEVLALVGGRGTKTGSRTFNRATESKRQPGSCFKVLSTFAPAIDSCGMTLATVYNDAPFNYHNGTAVTNWYGKDVYKGLCSLRYGIYYSLNIVAVKALTIITPELGFNYLTNFGFSTLVERDVINDMVFTDIGQTLALGGVTYGVYNLELNAAYASIANEGTYIEPKLYSRIEDANGNVIIDNTTPVTRQTITPQTAFLLTQGMIDCVQIGTGTSAKFSKMSIAGKTGTTSDGRDVWFSGYTPYYTCTIWTGYDNNEILRDAEQKTSRKMFKLIMSQMHEGLEDIGFTVPEGIVQCDVCKKSGKLPVAGLCDVDGCVYTEYFTEDTVPTETCDVHYYGPICSYDNMPASPGCPFTYMGVCERIPVEDPILWDGSTVIVTDVYFDPILNEEVTNTTVYSQSHTGVCQHDANFYYQPYWDVTLQEQWNDYYGNAPMQITQIMNTQRGEQYQAYLDYLATLPPEMWPKFKTPYDGMEVPEP